MTNNNDPEATALLVGLIYGSSQSVGRGLCVCGEAVALLDMLPVYVPPPWRDDWPEWKDEAAWTPDVATHFALQYGRSVGVPNLAVLDAHRRLAQWPEVVGLWGSSNAVGRATGQES